MRKISLYFVRHGQASHNIAAEIYGDYAYFDPLYTDSNLTEIGIKQATDLQHFFKKNNPDLVYSSPLKRCLQTLDYALVDHLKDIIVDDRLAERLGEHPCNKRSHKHEIIKHTKRKLHIDRVNDEHHWTSKREHDDEIIHRAKNWYHELLEHLKINKDIKKVAIFTHYDFLVTVLSKGLPFSNNELSKPFNNCEVREVQIDLE